MLEEQALFNTGNVSLDVEGRPTRMRILNVTPSYLRVMRTAPSLGRPFSEAEGEPGNERKLLLSDALWRSQFAADPAVVGRTLRLDGQPYEVVGVLPARLEALAPGIGLVRPLAFTPEEKSDDRRHSNNYWHVGRLEPGATIEQARSQVDALNAANLDRFPQFREPVVNAGFYTKVDRLSDHLVRHVKPVLYLLWGGASFVLGLVLLWALWVRGQLLLPAGRWRGSLTRLLAWRIVRVGIPTALERAAFNGGLLIFMGVVAGFGTAPISAYLIGVRILSFCFVPGSGFAMAAATLVGQNLGADQPLLAARSGWRSMRGALAVMGSVGPWILSALPPTIRLTVAPIPAFAQVSTDSGSKIAMTQPSAFCLSSSSRTSVESAALPPPTLSPASKSEMGVAVACMARATASAGVGKLGVSWSRAAHIMSAMRCAPRSANS